MKKIIKFIQDKVDAYVIKRFKKLMPKALITELYRMVAEKDLQITTREVSVKKGKIKYTLLVIQNKGLQTVFNLGRHGEDITCHKCGKLLQPKIKASQFLCMNPECDNYIKINTPQHEMSVQ